MNIAHLCATANDIAKMMDEAGWVIIILQSSQQFTSSSIPRRTPSALSLH
jgi:hypothetical protein